MEVKSESSQFDMSKICRACLAEKEVMQSVFMPDESIGQTLPLAEMIMNFTNVQIQTGDGLPSLICLDCIHQVTRSLSFKQLCEESDTNLRQIIERSPVLKEELKQEEIEVSDYSVVVESGTMDDSSNTSDPLDPANEILIAQIQLQKTIKIINSKLKENVLTKSDEVMLNETKKLANQCDVCKKQFINLHSFKKHLKTHIEDCPFKCKVCPRSFTKKYYCNNHMTTHIPNEQKPHECDVCKKRFPYQSLLNKHMLKHSTEKPFVCKICNKGCYAENSLSKHMKIHEKKEGDPDLLKHICVYCKSEFPDAVTLDVHIKQHTGDKPFLCTVCGKSFEERYKLDLHLRSHTGEKPFTCEICQNKYVSKANLNVHMRSHTNERPFACEFCGKAFRHSSVLTRHKRLHGTETPIECNICVKRFTSVMQLKYHMRNHTGERPYVCNVCGRGFTVNTILVRHLRTHTGEKPYVCAICGKAFAQSSTLSTHMKVHAPSPKYNNQDQ
ncbi:gastrula zinc finger protein XlCGF57.1-like [Onthophagus taurus]|uniref:gastrula zinc finger protein XlCGF57.1-like n=1 Tax=Onthophagus taurus TaxID=166361 RepID=UPI0039BE4DDB